MIIGDGVPSIIECTMCTALGTPRKRARVPGIQIVVPGSQAGVSSTVFDALGIRADVSRTL